MNLTQTLLLLMTKVKNSVTICLANVVEMRQGLRTMKTKCDEEGLSECDIIKYWLEC